jgi:hypothetical protein
MSEEYKRHTTQTQVTAPSGKTATFGDVARAVSEHHENCAAEQSAARGQQWSEITAIKLTLEGISARLRAAVWIIGLGVTLAGSLGVFIAKYAIVGAITIELDKRMPPRMSETPKHGGESLAVQP